MAGKFKYVCHCGCAGTEWKGLSTSLMFHERILLFLNTTIKFFVTGS